LTNNLKNPNCFEKAEAGGEKIMDLNNKLSNEVQTKPILLLTVCGFVSGCEALALSGRAACTKPLLAAAAVNLVGT